MPMVMHVTIMHLAIMDMGIMDMARAKGRFRFMGLIR
jgi:hypothetical protein